MQATMRTLLVLVVTGAFAVLISCSTNSPNTNDGGAPDGATAGDATCVFGSSHYGDGCKFGP